MRLLTRSDFDGLVCGALLKSLGVVDSFKFVHPKDMQDGIVEVTKDDVLANVPYAEGCGMWFDHHESEALRSGVDSAVPGKRNADAPSAARVIYEYYGGESKMPHFAELVRECDKVDSGRLTPEEIKNPPPGVLLGFIMDPRTGLGRFREFTISNYELMMRLLDACAEKQILEILELPDVKERLDLYNEQIKLFDDMLKEHTRVVDNVIVTDLRGVSTIYAGNRFYLYGLYPEQNVSLWIVDGRAGINVSIAIGKSILKRDCKSNIGEICLKYGGGGHFQVGTCQVSHEEADKVIEEITEMLVENEKV